VTASEVQTRGAAHTAGASASAAARRFDPAPLIFFAAALLLYVVRLQVPDTYVFDEVYHAYTAGQYAIGNADAYVWNTHATRPHVAYMWNHPPAGVLLIAAGIRVFGDNSFGWRISSALFGALGIAIAYLLALKLTRRRDAAILTAILLLCDQLYFVQSRIGMLDIFGVVFMTCAFYAFHSYLEDPPERAAGSLMRTGLFLGLAVATKWNAAYAAILIGIVVIVRAMIFGFAARRAGGDAVTARAAWRTHAWATPVGLIAIPAFVYFAAYVPFFLTGHTGAQWVELQKQIFYYHSRLRDVHSYQSKWWTWPFTVRPVWYHVTYTPGHAAHIYANGSTLLYWAFLPAVFWICAWWWKEHRASVAVLALGFFGQWLPWMLVPRISFIYHFLPAAVFGTIAVAWVLSELMRMSRWGRAFAVVYVALVALSFVYFYPIRAAVPLTPHQVGQRMWAPTWH
jgi:dolichyl-phosphate-mannose--protein O-mannosyl transferase